MKTGMERAKELFLQYSGNRFYMDLNGDGYEYDGYRVSAETEEAWRREYLARFFEEKRYGKEAVSSYGHAAAFLKSDRSDECWEEILYYPIRSDWLDDVTILFMLPTSFRLAEKWYKKGKFSRKEAEEYLQALDGFVRSVRKRADTETLTRAEVFDRQEFSDPVYVAAYLTELWQKWTGLFRNIRK